VIGWAGGLFALVGAGIHGLTAVMIWDELASNAPASDPLAAVAGSGALLVGLWALAAILMLAACIAFALEASRGRSDLAGWIAWSNPLVLTLVLGLIGLATEPLRSFLTPAAPNLAHALFFAAASLTSSPKASVRSSIRSQRSGTRSRLAIKPKSR